MPIPMINTESNIEKFVILLEDSIKNQDLKKSRKIIQFLKEDYQRQDKAISVIAKLWLCFIKLSSWRKMAF
jgi:ABC-type enterochelin transport system ATPase subunit